jgi:hypothetical protein
LSGLLAVFHIKESLKYLRDELLKEKKMAGTNEMLKDMLPYGGAVNIHGEITWRVTEKEFNEMKRNLECIFDDSH